MMQIRIRRSLYSHYPIVPLYQAPARVPRDRPLLFSTFGVAPINQKTVREEQMGVHSIIHEPMQRFYSKRSASTERSPRGCMGFPRDTALYSLGPDIPIE